MHLHSTEPNICSPSPHRKHTPCSLLSLPALLTSAPFSLLHAPMKTHALTRALTYVSTRDRGHIRKQEEEEDEEKERERERRWLIRTCVMTIANHLLNGADTYRCATVYLLAITKGSFKSEPHSVPTASSCTSLIFLDLADDVSNLSSFRLTV